MLASFGQTAHGKVSQPPQLLKLDCTSEIRVLCLQIALPCEEYLAVSACVCVYAGDVPPISPPLHAESVVMVALADGCMPGCVGARRVFSH